MKTILCFCMPLFFFVMLSDTVTFAQTPLSWSTTALLGGNAFGSIRPRVTVPGDNLPVIVFGSPDSLAIFKVKSTGTTFSAPQRITPIGINAVSMTWQGQEIASNGNNVFMTFKCSPETDQPIYTVKSSNAGLSFQNIVRVDDIGGDVCRFPCVDILPDGNPVVAFMRFDAGFTSPRYVVANSVDGGLSYLPDVIASTNVFAGDVCDCCPANITVNGNVQVMSYRNNDVNIRDIKSVLSFTNGSSFPSGIAVDNTNWLINQCPSTGPDVVIAGDSLITVWKSGSSSQRVWVSCANINNTTIGTYGMLHNNGTIQNFPRIAGNGDTLGVVWEEKSGNQTYIKFTYSVTGAKGLFLNQVTISTSLQNQTKPDIAYRNGTFHVVWSDESTNKCVYRKATVPGATNIAGNHIQNVHVFPSPFENSFTVKSDATLVSVVLTDISGKIILSKNCENKNVIEFMTENIESGIYIITITDSHNQKLIRRIVKE